MSVKYCFVNLLLDDDNLVLNLTNFSIFLSRFRLKQTSDPTSEYFYYQLCCLTDL